MDSIYEHVQDSNALHIILKSEAMSSKEKRDNLMCKMFDLVRIRNIPLPGNETGTTKKSLIVYISPKESLQRLLGDSVVFSQYIESGTPDERYQGTLGDLTSIFSTLCSTSFEHLHY